MVPGGRDHGHLAVAEAGALAQLVRLFPALLRAVDTDRAGHVAVIDAVHRVAMHADHFEERLFVLRVAGERPDRFARCARWSDTPART